MKKALQACKKYYLIFIIFIISIIGLILPSKAVALEVNSITPNKGSSAVPTTVTIKGLGFEATPYAAIYGGGPYQVGWCDTMESAQDIFVLGSYAYVAEGSSGVQIIDISNPSAPHIVGSCDTPGNAYSVFVAGSYAYVADGTSGLQVIAKYVPFTDITLVDSETLTAMLPAGFRPGTYNLHITNPDSGHVMLPNAFTVGIDEDKDGVIAEEDCDDIDDTVYPGAPEIYDGKDNDCDGCIDEDFFACEGDFNSDGDVDGTDLAMFASDFGRTNCVSAPMCEGDFDKDGDVDGSDLEVFAADFGRTDCPLCK